MENIKISNFRKIKETWDLDLAPITFLTGTNNSGKSTILKSLLLLEDHINSDNHFELDFNGEKARKHKVDCFDNAINRLNKAHNNKDLFFQYSNRGYDVRFWFQPGEDKTNGKGKLVKLELEREDKAKLAIYNIGGLNYQLEFDDTLIGRRIESKDDEARSKDKDLVKTIQNLLYNDEKKLGELENNVEELEKKIKNKKKETVEEESKREKNQNCIACNGSGEVIKEKGTILGRMQTVLPCNNCDGTGKKNDKNTPESTISKNEDSNNVPPTIRFNKVLRELNVSIDRAVEFLNSKGLEIEKKPTTKINEITYNILAEEFQTDANKLIASTNPEAIILYYEKELKRFNQKIISLKQEITESKKKLRIANKKLEENIPTEKSVIIYRPSFSLEDFHPSERTIERIIKRVLPEYLRSNDKSIKLAGAGGGSAQAFRLGERINSALHFSVDHLSPHRNNQTRLYINNNTSTDINELIKQHSNNPINKKSKAGVFLKNWMRKFDIGDNYDIKSIDGVASKILVYEDNDWVNMVDKGFGAGQIFAIILKVALCIDSTRKSSSFRYSNKRQQLIVVEEPEANLHPALQSKLADLFMAAYSEFGIRFIIETHSEYVIRQSQFLNLEHPKLFGLYYFDKNEGPYAMIYMENGKFDRPFGTGFFNVADDLAVNMYKANLKSK
ncbi:AAA family ATPase [Bizionia paragorgiae]|uniref:AAA domain-containing protein, putative AbiEii toxin, Type IV TA system n=1 Tax=Bizionia paragorgiae TaxID=283786 RepID=A0A1H3X165_BIZPA|nr:AAA family ATPase [Bizionia paragorgiae]SDZ93145.1 AAA domain-containing protein, putative AbiEii toxin, Type IV TA system [Bizionia paragorgiae]